MKHELIAQNLISARAEIRAQAYQEAVDCCSSTAGTPEHICRWLSSLCQKYLLDCILTGTSELDSDYVHTDGEAALELSVPFGMLAESDECGRRQLWDQLANELNGRDHYFPDIVTHFLEGYGDAKELTSHMKVWKNDRNLNKYVSDLEEILGVAFL